jgi:hypothetical protein
MTVILKITKIIYQDQPTPVSRTCLLDNKQTTTIMHNYSTDKRIFFSSANCGDYRGIKKIQTSGAKSSPSMDYNER